MTSSSAIAYSCYYTQSREGEQFVAQHVLSYQVSGTLSIHDGSQEYIFRGGDFRFIKRNQLLKFNKQPPPGGAFKSVSVYFDKSMLKDFAIENGHLLKEINKEIIPSVVPLTSVNFYKSFIDSLISYIEPNEFVSKSLQLVKQREALILLLETNPELKSILFDFSEPGKIDLEEFMQRNFQFNVHLSRFAYLTGRSLATFKRDFDKIFHVPPGKWLQQRRLSEAHYLIKEKGKMPSDVYLEVGFEDLSHFSFAFKKMYGLSPSRVVS